MEETKKQYKLKKKECLKESVALALKGPLTVLATATVFGLAVSPLLAITYGSGEHIFKRDYNTTYAYEETIDTFSDTHTTTSEFNYDGYESILGNQEEDKNKIELPKSYVTEYGEWKSLENGEYARNIKYYDVSSFDYDKALKLLTGSINNQDINIEEYFKTPVKEDVEISNNISNNTKYKLTYYSIDEENTIVSKESHLEHGLEMLEAIICAVIVDVIFFFVYVVMIMSSDIEFPIVYNMWEDVISRYQDLFIEKKKLRELKALLELKKDSSQLTKKIK